MPSLWEYYEGRIVLYRGTGWVIIKTHQSENVVTIEDANYRGIVLSVPMSVVKLTPPPLTIRDEECPGWEWDTND